jgi:2-oxoglutarate ferredoxin oxidoreductase subunit alpha
VVQAAAEPTRLGVIYFGSTSPAMQEALALLAQQGIHIDAMRLRAFPFPQSVVQFLAEHAQVFVVEQNRDAQLRSLLMLDLGVHIEKLESVRYYAGFPMSAHHVISGVKAKLEKVA